MTQRQVIVRDAGHQALDELDATDIPALAYDASGAAATAQSAAIAAAASDATTKANAAAAASVPTSRTITAGTGLTGGGDLSANRSIGVDFGEAGDISTQAFGDAASAGSTGEIADAGHKHAMPASPKFGRLVYGGNTGYQIPGVFITATSTLGLTVNTLLYQLCWTPTAIVIDQVAFVVTTGPASGANVRIGIYAGVDGQPSGAPLVDVGVAVASGFTGIKTASASATIPAGHFLIAINCDVTMSLRLWSGASVAGYIDPSLSSGSQVGGGSVASAYGAMPTNVPWTFAIALTTHVAVIRILTP